MNTVSLLSSSTELLSGGVLTGASSAWVEVKPYHSLALVAVSDSAVAAQATLDIETSPDGSANSGGVSATPLTWAIGEDDLARGCLVVADACEKFVRVTATGTDALTYALIALPSKATSGNASFFEYTIVEDGSQVANNFSL